MSYPPNDISQLLPRDWEGGLCRVRQAPLLGLLIKQAKFTRFVLLAMGDKDGAENMRRIERECKKTLSKIKVKQ